MNDDSKLKRLRTRPGERNWAMARLGMGTGMRVAGHALANAFRSEDSRRAHDRSFYRSEAEHLADALGELKGSVMKAGQMLSLYGQYFMPPEATEILARLQDDTVHVDWSVIEPVVHAALGSARMAELDIDTEPLAAASLGQVHRVRRRDGGIELCLKVRYPGVDEAIDSDVRTIARLLSLSRLVPEGLSLQPVFTEVREMLHREVDYLFEAEMTRRFRDQLLDDRRFVVPEVVDRYSGSELLALSFETGLSLNDPRVLGLPQDTRDAIGAAFLEQFLREFFRWGLVQTDPHFGNYRIRLDEDGAWRIVLLDFGATRRFPHGFVQDYARIVGGGIEADEGRIRAGAVGIGLMEDDFPDAVFASFVALCRLIVEPFTPANAPPGLHDAAGRYDWGASDLPTRVTRCLGRSALTRHFRIPPREIVFLHRRLAGVFILLAHLGVKLDGRAAVSAALQAASTADAFEAL